MDEEIGRVVDSLKNKGMWDNTLVIFMSGQYVHSIQNCVKSLKRKDRHVDEFTITGTGSCQNENFRYSQWWQIRQTDDLSCYQPLRKASNADRWNIPSC